MYQFSDAFGPEEVIGNKKPQEANELSKARKCLNSDEFKEYKAEFERIKESMLNKMIGFTKDFIACDSGDMAFYGAKMMRIVTRLEDLKVLLNQVEIDSRKTEQKEDESNA